MLDILAAQSAGKGTALEATASVLADKVDTRTTLADEFVMFTTWNAATGKRAGTGGYRNAKSYPLATTFADFPSGAPAQVDGLTAGLSARYYLANDPNPRQLSLTADETRLAAIALPLESGKARMDLAKSLPAVVTGETILILGGRSSKKTDVVYTLAAQPIDPGADAGAGTDSDTTIDNTPPAGSNGGCSWSASNGNAGSYLPSSLAIIVLSYLGTFRRGRSRTLTH